MPLPPSVRRRALAAVTVVGLVAGGALLAAAPASADPAGAPANTSSTSASPLVTGSVLEGGVGVAGVKVWADFPGSRATRPASAFATTDAQGAYSLPVAAGNWQLRIEAPSSRPALLPASSAEIAVTVTDSGARKDIDVVQGGFIAGSVSGPAELGADYYGVSVLEASTGRIVQSDSTSAGAYTTAALRPGDYKVAFAASGSVTGFAVEYFDGVADLADADVVTVGRTGATVGSVDGTVRPKAGHHKVTFVSTDESFSGLMISEAGDPSDGIKSATYGAGQKQYAWLVDGDYWADAYYGPQDAERFEFTVAGETTVAVQRTRGTPTIPTTPTNPTTPGTPSAPQTPGTPTTGNRPLTEEQIRTAIAPQKDVPNPAVSTSATTAKPGDAIRVSAAGFAAGEAVDVYVYSVPRKIGTLRADASGATAGQVTLPADLPLGTHHIRLVGTTSGVAVWSNSIEVTADGRPSALAQTGLNGTTPLIAAIAALLLVGAALLVLARRRQVAVRR